MKFKRALVTGAIFLSMAIPVSVSAFHCSGGFVYVGDTSLAVLKKCGEPHYKDVVKIGLSSREEKWHYDFGERTIPHTVTIRDGKVIRIEH
jgi:hypothetical protein